MQRDLPIDADVTCQDGRCGTATCLILDPVTHRVTHLVVAEPGPMGTQRMVPVPLVAASTHDSIRLDCTWEEWTRLEPFVEVHDVRQVYQDVTYTPGMWYFLPISTQQTIVTPVVHERIPSGEVAIHRGAQVEARDGPVGRVDEFQVDADDQHITHLVVQEGRLWPRRARTVPGAAIKHIGNDSVRLKLSKKELKTAP